MEGEVNTFLYIGLGILVPLSVIYVLYFTYWLGRRDEARNILEEWRRER